MARVAALTLADHPWHGRAAPGPAGLGLVVDADKHGDDRRARYDLAAAWCAAGACLPVPWAWPLDPHELTTLDAGRLKSLQTAVRDAADQVEWAFRVEPGASSATDGPASPDDGRSYLAAMRRRVPASVRLEPALRRAAGDHAFGLEALSDRDGLLTGILVGRRHAAAVWSTVLEAVLGEMQGRTPSVAGPLPPFASAAAALRRAGLDPRPVGRPQ